jgi:DNA-binding XRE family transcriptional regulator
MGRIPIMEFPPRTEPTNHLREVREKAGLSRGGLARRADLSNESIERLEGKGDPTPTLSTARKIASALGVSVEDIWPTPRPDEEAAS